MKPEFESLYHRERDRQTERERERTNDIIEPLLIFTSMRPVLFLDFLLYKTINLFVSVLSVTI
jgi:hypothetical protein